MTTISVNRSKNKNKNSGGYPPGPLTVARYARSFPSPQKILYETLIIYVFVISLSPTFSLLSPQLLDVYSSFQKQDAQ